MIKGLVLVTGNSPKAREVERILKIPIERIDLDIDEIQSMDPKKIVLHKAKEAYRIVQKPLIVDDVSFEVEAWNGFPGPFIKWLLESKNDPSLMLRMLGNEMNRSAKARLFIGFHDASQIHIFSDEVKGTITYEARGDNGFGWDKVFIPDGFDQTFAEMNPEVKDSTSHRAKALKELKAFLEKQK